MYSDDAIVWRNADGVERPMARVPPSASRLRDARVDLSFENVRSHVATDGFTIEYEARARLPDGDDIVIPTCVVVTVEDGLITRTAEYADSAQAARLLAFLA